MTADEKLARQRMSVLQLAETLNNVSEACRQRGVSRTQFYEYKRRFQTHGMQGLKDKFGLSWQIVPRGFNESINDPDHSKVIKVMNTILKMKKIIIKDLEFV